MWFIRILLPFEAAWMLLVWCRAGREACIAGATSPVPA